MLTWKQTILLIKKFKNSDIWSWFKLQMLSYRIYWGKLVLWNKFCSLKTLKAITFFNAFSFHYILLKFVSITICKYILLW